MLIIEVRMCQVLLTDAPAMRSGQSTMKLMHVTLVSKKVSSRDMRVDVLASAPKTSSC